MLLSKRSNTVLSNITSIHENQKRRTHHNNNMKSNNDDNNNNNENNFQNQTKKVKVNVVDSDVLIFTQNSADDDHNNINTIIQNETVNHSVVSVGQSLQLKWNIGISSMFNSRSDYINGNYSILQQRLLTDGYLYISQCIPYQTSIKARNRIIQHLKRKGVLIKTQLQTKDNNTNANTNNNNIDIHDNNVYINAIPKDKNCKGYTVDAETGG